MTKGVEGVPDEMTEKHAPTLSIEKTAGRSRVSRRPEYKLSSERDERKTQLVIFREEVLKDFQNIVQAVNDHAGLVADKKRLLSVCNCAANTLKISGANGEWSMRLLNTLNEAIEKSEPNSTTARDVQCNP